MGPEHPDVAGLLGTLAQLYKAQKAYERARPLLSRALELSKKTHGKEHPRVALLLNSMGELDRLTGDQEGAESLAQQSLRLLESSLGPTHPYVARILNNLALISKANGDYKRAKILLERALSIDEKAWRTEHPDVAATLNNLAELYRAEGDVKQALPLHAQAIEIIERHLALVLTSGSEEQNRLYLTTLASSTDSIISLNTREAPNEAQATRLAMTTVLRHKGRVLNTTAGSIAAIRQRLDPAGRELLNRLASVRSELAMLILKGESEISFISREIRINELEAEADKSETAIINKLADFGVYSQPITLAKIQEGIPEDAALVEIIAYKPFNQKSRVENTTWGEERYVAYVLKRHGEPVGVELGDAKSINKTAIKFRSVLATSQSPVKAVARELDEMVMRPIRRLLGPAKHLLLSPDGVLNIIPFGALVNEDDRFLLQDYTLTYLTSGSDLVRMQSRRPSQQSPFILANPTVNFKDTLSRRPANLAIPSSPPRGALQEAQYLHDRIPDSTFVSGGAATEKALKNIHSPSILHVSTYSFFKYSSLDHEAMASSSPLIHAGLILAEAGQQNSTGEDGIMTALEATMLDLHGTQLVVLSGCETGVGELQDGEGVYGFRRALVIAGSETQVISLWKVADASTQELIIGYYQRVLAGEGRAEALWRVQLSMLASNAWKHPFYWASFIQSGDWRSMDVKNFSIK